MTGKVATTARQTASGTPAGVAQRASAEKAFAAKANDAQGKAAAPATGKSAPGKSAPDKSPPNKPEAAKPAAAAPNIAKPQASASAPASNPLDALARAGGEIGRAIGELTNGFRAGGQETRERVSTVAQHMAGTPPEWIAREKPIPQTGSLPEAAGKAVSSVIGTIATLPLMPADNYLKARQEADAKGMPHDQAKAKANASYWLGAAEMSTSALPPGPAAIMSGLVETGRQLQAGERDLGRIARRAAESALASYALDKAGDNLGDLLGGKGTGGGPGAPGRMPGELEPVRIGADPASPAPRAPEPNQPSRMASDDAPGPGRQPFQGVGRGMSMEEAIQNAKKGDLSGIPERYLTPKKLERFAKEGGVDLTIGESTVAMERINRIGEKMYEMAPADVKAVVGRLMERDNISRPSVEIFDQIAAIYDHPEMGPQLREHIRSPFGGSDYEVLVEQAIARLQLEHPAYRDFSDLYGGLDANDGP